MIIEENTQEPARQHGFTISVAAISPGCNDWMLPQPKMIVVVVVVGKPVVVVVGPAVVVVVVGPAVVVVGPAVVVVVVGNPVVPLTQDPFRQVPEEQIRPQRPQLLGSEPKLTVAVVPQIPELQTALWHAFGTGQS